MADAEVVPDIVAIAGGTLNEKIKIDLMPVCFFILSFYSR